jgi:hypothetical protein
MAFQVIYSNTDLIAKLSETPTTKSKINSSGLAVEVAEYSSQFNASCISFVNGVQSSRISSDGTKFDMTDPLHFAGSAGILAVVNKTGFNVEDSTNDSVASFTPFATTITNAQGSFTSTAQGSSISLGTSATSMNVEEFKIETNTAGGGLLTRMMSDRIEISNLVVGEEENTIIDKKSITFTKIAGSTNITLSDDGQKLTMSSIQPNSILDVSGNAGTAGQYLLSNGTAPVWADIPSNTPNLTSVLAVANAGDASNQPISNLSSVGFQTTTLGNTPLTITAAASAVPEATFDVLAVPYEADETTSRIFAQKYVEISVGGQSYWVQLFSAPDP